MDIEICADPFVRDSTLPLFIDAIGNFKLDNCQCFREDDRPILYNKAGFKGYEGHKASPEMSPKSEGEAVLQVRGAVRDASEAHGDRPLRSLHSAAPQCQGRLSA